MSDLPQSTIEAMLRAYMWNLDARTDEHIETYAMRKALQAALDEGGVVLASEQFGPVGDNHHNAAACPYCSPDRERYIESEHRIREAARAVLHSLDVAERLDVGIQRGPVDHLRQELER